MKKQQQNQTKSSSTTTTTASVNTTKPTRSTTGNVPGRKPPYNQQQTTSNTMKKQYNATGNNNNNVTESYNNQSIMPIKKEQMYRMLDKLFHLLNNPVTHESFVSASSLYKEISNYLSLAELKSIGDAWRNLYTEENETGYSNLKTVISSVKSRFA